MTIEGDLIHPIAMEEGLRFAIREGGRTVGSGIVSTIISKLALDLARRTYRVPGSSAGLILRRLRFARP